MKTRYVVIFCGCYDDYIFGGYLFDNKSDAEKFINQQPLSEKYKIAEVKY